MKSRLEYITTIIDGFFNEDKAITLRDIKFIKSELDDISSDFNNCSLLLGGTKKRRIASNQWNIVEHKWMQAINGITITETVSEEIKDLIKLL